MGQWERKPFCTTDVLQLLGCLGSFGGDVSIGQELLPSILKHIEQQTPTNDTIHAHFTYGRRMDKACWRDFFRGASDGGGG